jgi:hypothetical protein
MQDNTPVFIVRLWLEHREIAGAAPLWRGSVEHVASGAKQYILALDEILAFIMPYLNVTDPPVPLSQPERRWLHRRRDKGKKSQ